MATDTMHSKAIRFKHLSRMTQVRSSRRLVCYFVTKSVIPFLLASAESVRERFLEDGQFNTNEETWEDFEQPFRCEIYLNT